MTAAVTKRTEAEMLQLLRARHAEKAGNGEAWAFCTHVRNAAGFDAARTVDAIAMSLWPSRGLELIGFEVKCSRSDWVRELQRPEKAEAFAVLVDRWYLVVADDKIVQPGELPPTWGLLVARGKKLVCVTEAPRLRPATSGGRKAEPVPPGFGRSFLAALLRASNKSSVTAEELLEVRRQATAAAEGLAADLVDSWKKKAEELQELVAEFEQAVGLPGYLANRFYTRSSPKELGQAVRLVMDGNRQAEDLEKRLRRIVEDANTIAEMALETIGDPA